MNLSSSTLFLGNVSSEYLIIRPLLKRDFKQYQEIFINPQTTEFTGGPLTTREIKDNFNNCLKALEIQAIHYLTLAIIVKGDNTMIGIATLIGQDRINDRLELGVMFNQQNQRKGYASELVNRLLEYCFKTYALDSVFSFTLMKNIPAQLVLKKIGFVKCLKGPLASYDAKGIYWTISKKHFE